MRGRAKRKTNRENERKSERGRGRHMWEGVEAAERDKNG